MPESDVALSIIPSGFADIAVAHFKADRFPHIVIDMIENCDSYIFVPTKFSGSIETPRESFPITFSVEVGSDCHLKIEIDPVPAETYFALSKTMGKPGAVGEEFVLKGSSSDDGKFNSSTIAVTEHNSGSEFRIKVSHRSATITCRSKVGEYTDKPAARLWLRGFKSFHNLPVDTKLGKLSIHGDHKNVTRESISGCITVETDVVKPGADWFSEVDDFLTFMMRGLGFAHGGRLQTPRLDQVTGKEWRSTFYSGNGFESHLPAIHSLAQGDFIRALAERYEKQEPFPEMLWTAIGWLHAGATIDEVRFLNMMTAFETIVENVVPETATTILPKPDFRPIRAELEGVIDTTDLSDEQKTIFKNKIGQLNSRSLYHKIEAMKIKFGLSDQLFNKEVVKTLTKTRNNITHTGSVRDGVDLWKQILLAREMIAMVVFSEINYRGPFESYAEGYQTRSPA